jgi:hypothetical protein
MGGRGVDPWTGREKAERQRAAALLFRNAPSLVAFQSLTGSGVGGDFARDSLPMSYDPVPRDMFRLAAMLVAKILTELGLPALAR